MNLLVEVLPPVLADHEVGLTHFSELQRSRDIANVAAVRLINWVSVLRGLRGGDKFITDALQNGFR